jgi:predicted alpha/beta superfamily hydrolase
MPFLIALLVSVLPLRAQQPGGAQPAKTKPFVLGVVDEIQSAKLGEKRVLNIYLPEGYTRNDTTAYPVTFLLDGSADEDFIHVVGLFQFNNFSWIDRVPRSIVVGIATVDRRRDFTYPTTIEGDKKKYPTTGHSDRFIAFLRDELQPYIAKKYGGRGAKTLIGQSLGGLLAAQIVLEQPALFNKYVIVSPSLWWDNGSLLKRPVTPLDNLTRETSVYVGVGKEGIAPGDPPRMMEVDANLLADKVRDTKGKHMTVHFDYLPAEDHATILHQALFNALRLLYPVSTTHK